eukprot:1477465-Amphidinium_carterae.1
MGALQRVAPERKIASLVTVTADMSLPLVKVTWRGAALANMDSNHCALGEEIDRMGFLEGGILLYSCLMCPDLDILPDFADDANGVLVMDPRMLQNLAIRRIVFESVFPVVYWLACILEAFYSSGTVSESPANRVRIETKLSGLALRCPLGPSAVHVLLRCCLWDGV